MTYVLDASVAIKWVLPESDSDRAVLLQNLELIAPDTFPVEIAHALTRSERRGILPVGTAGDRLTDILAFAPTFHSSFSLLWRGVDLSSQTRTSVYDCLYVALAEAESCELITADAKLMRALPNAPLLDLATFSP